MQIFNWAEDAHDWMIEEMKKVPGGLSEEERQAKRARTSTGKGYYETVDGFKCDLEIVDVCRDATAATGADGLEGRISLEDARKVWERATISSKVTDCEKWTLRMCLTLFKWSRAGHDFVNEQICKLNEE